jgi:Flp pilus assembly protein TadD
VGFICIKRGRFEKALDYLESGRQLEPTQPVIAFEKAQALVRSGRRQEALKLYNQFSQVGPFVNGRHLAVALRGRGFILIELGDMLDEAERAFRDSLEFDPNNSLALNELEYIRRLRQGGDATSRTQSFLSQAKDPSTCARCGKAITEGILVSLRDTPVVVCKRCHDSFPKD